MWSTLFLTKIVKLSRATTAVKSTNTATQNSPTKKHSFFSPAHLRFLRQMLLPNMRPVRIIISCAKPPTRTQQWKKAIATTVLIMACGSYGPVYGLGANATDSTRYTFDIPSLKVEEALSQLAKQTGHQLLFSYALVNSHDSTAVKGEHSLTSALQQLLQTTPLTGHLTERGVIVVTDTSARNHMEKGRGNMNITTKKGLLAGLVGLFAAGGMTQAVAQGGEAATGQSAIDEIVVTATKRATSLQDTAMSISALSSETIEKRGLVGMEDYLQAMPGVSYQDRGAGQNAIVMRGLSANPQTDNEAVGVYFGETPTAGLSNASTGGGGGNLDIKLVDIDRVEVLRGPQGTLYGSGSMGGTVRVIPNAPNAESLEGSISVNYSNTSEEGGNNTMVQGVLNIPLVQDELAVRAVAYNFRNSGFIKNVAASSDPDVDAILAGGKAFGAVPVNRDDVGNDTYKGFRLTTMWLPADNLDITFGYTTQEIEQTGWPEVDLALDDFQQARLPVRDGLSEGLENKVDIINLNANFRTSWGEFTSTSSWIDYEHFSLFDFSFLLGLPIDSRGEKIVDNFVQEIRFSSDFDGPLQLLAGAYYEDRKSSRDFTLLFTGDPDMESTVISFFTAPPLPETFFSQQTFVDNVTQQAVFGELSYKITDQFTATFGGRYFEYEQEAPITLIGIFGDDSSNVSNKDSGSTYKLNLSYQLSDDVLIYGEWAEGFRLGAPQIITFPGCDADGNGLAELPDGSEIKIPDNVSPDELENFELGIKTSFAENSVILNASIYRINWSGMPVQTQLACGPSIIVNAGESTSEGVELETQIMLSENLRIDLSASYGEAKLAEDAPGLGASALKGTDLPGSANFNSTASIEYDFTLGRADAFIRFDYAYVGEYYSSFAKTGQNSGDYSTLNAKVGASIDQFNMDIFVKNLSNSDDFTWTENQFGFSRAYQLRPRTIGVNFGYTF